MLIKCSQSKREGFNEPTIIVMVAVYCSRLKKSRDARDFKMADIVDDVFCSCLHVIYYNPYYEM